MSDSSYPTISPPPPAPRWPVLSRQTTGNEDSLAQFNYFDSSDLGGYSTPIETVNETPSSLPQPPASPASSFGSMDSGVSHPPRAERRAKKIVSMRYRDFASKPTAKSRDPGGSSVGNYLCDVPECTSGPFGTPSLLRAHTSVHLPARRFFCPVKGCRRSEGGVGFSSQYQRNRHQIHRHGYICPFCTGRKRRFFHSDALKSHARFDHPDKDQDDPQLQEALRRRSDKDTEEITVLQEDIKRIREENENLKLEIDKQSRRSLVMTGQIAELQDALQRSVG